MLTEVLTSHAAVVLPVAVVFMIGKETLHVEGTLPDDFDKEKLLTEFREQLGIHHSGSAGSSASSSSSSSTSEEAKDTTSSSPSSSLSTESRNNHIGLVRDSNFSRQNWASN